MSKFVTSTNIIRDEHSMFDYIVTRNAIDIFLEYYLIINLANIPLTLLVLMVQVNLHSCGL